MVEYNNSLNHIAMKISSFAHGYQDKRGGILVKSIIYLDVLIILNIYVGFFLFIGTGKLLGEKLKKWRLFAGSIASGIFSLLILFELSPFIQIASKLFMGILLVLIVFPFKSAKYILKCIAIFFLINFIYGGFMFALWFFIAPTGMVYKNGVTYFNISAIGLVVSTIVAYLIISGVCAFLNRRTKESEKVQVGLSFCGRQTMLTGLCDTGNKLCDAFSGLPVVVCEYSSVASLFPEVLKSYFLNPLEYPELKADNTAYMSKLRLVPIEVVGSSSMLPAFKPEQITISGKEKQAIVAVTSSKLSEGEFQAIVNSTLL